MKDFRTNATRKPVPKSRLDVIRENRLKKKSGKPYKVSSKKGLFRGHRMSKRVKKILLVILFVLVIALIVGGIRGLAYLQDLNNSLPTPDKVFPDLPVASEIYDRKALDTDPSDGTTLYRLFSQYNSDPVNIAEIPESVKWSFLAAEDADFYTHGAFDVTGILRCGLAYLRQGSVSCGGSTITQQLVKITALGADPSVQRKIEELLLATKVEQLYSKDTILEMYLRVAPFGSNIYGVKTAANFYFGKEPKDLDLAQATLLAAIIQDPVRFSPTLSTSKTQVYCRTLDGLIVDSSNVTKADDGKLTDNLGEELIQAMPVKCRQLYILNQMETKLSQINNQTRTNKNDPNLPDVLTKDMIEAAKTEELKYQPPLFDKKAGNFVDYVLDALTTDNYNNGQPFTLDELQKGGYKIYTTLDYSVQQTAESYTAKAVSDNLKYNMHNAAVMTTQPSTGQIIAMSGSKDYYGTADGCDANGQNCKYDPQVNVLTSLQSPGSSNKPMGFYLAYDEGKIFTGSFLPDIALDNIDSSGYTPKDWNGGFLGLGAAAYMIQQSRNIPAIIVLKLIGVQTYLDTARKWGYTTYGDDSQYGLSVILGGTDVRPDEHAQAYSVFANEGDLVKLNPILEIVDKNGKIVYTPTVNRTNVASAQGTYLVDQSLYRLNANLLSWDDRDYAAKTGTSENSTDAWTMMWSPDFVTVAWGGNNNNDPMDQNNGYPPTVIEPWLQEYMRDIGGAPYFATKTPFPRPAFVYQGGGDCNTDGCLGYSTGWLIEGKTPPRDIIKKTYTVCTDELDHLARPIDIAMGKSTSKEFIYYTMPVPEWQHFLDDYEKNVEHKPNVFPTQPCDIDRSGGVSGPYFSFSALSATTSSIHIQGGIYTSSSGGTISSATFYLDNKVIPSCIPASYSNFDITCNISSLNLPDTGEYSFKATATDSSSITNTSAITVVTVGSQVTSNFLLTAPSAPVVANTSRLVKVNYSGGSNLTNVNLYMTKNGGSVSLVGGMVPQGGNAYQINWTNSGAGSYVLFATGNIQGSTGVVQSPNVTVTVN